jgi:hypothetical protein
MARPLKSKAEKAANFRRGLVPALRTGAAAIFVHLTRMGKTCFSQSIGVIHENTIRFFAITDLGPFVVCASVTLCVLRERNRRRRRAICVWFQLRRFQLLALKTNTRVRNRKQDREARRFHSAPWVVDMVGKVFF